LIKERAKAIEEGAERMSQAIRAKGGDPDEEEKVNDMLIDAIEAKLAILDE